LPDYYRGNIDDQRKVVECVRKVVEELKEKPDETPSQRLERFGKKGVQNGPPPEAPDPPPLPEAPVVKKFIAWKRAIFDIEIGGLLMQTEPGQSEGRLRNGVSRLEKHFPAEEQLVFAYERLAEALRLQSKFGDALPVAEKAVALNPFLSGAIRQLGLVHFGLANYDQAEKELRRSFALDPFEFDPETLRFIGLVPWNRGAALTNREERRSEFKKVIETFDQAVDSAKTDWDRGELHFWLGRFHGDLMEYDSSAKHFEMARALRTYPVDAACIWDGRASSRNCTTARKTVCAMRFRRFYNRGELRESTISGRAKGRNHRRIGGRRRWRAFPKAKYRLAIFC
jgi:tetratricopeptide (TPR) repeat protein